MLRHVLAIALLSMATTAVLAQNLSVIKERRDHYEEMGKAVKKPSAMFKGDEEFELDDVQAAIKVIQEKMAILPKLFPDDSKTGGKTEALPAIWEDKADFEDRFVKLAEAAKVAETKITDEISFQETWKDLVGNCSGCHKKYRKPRDR